MPAAPAPSRPAAEPILFDVRPTRLTINEIEARFEFEVAIRNASGAAAEGIRFTLGMISACPDQDAMCELFHRDMNAGPAIEPFDLPHGATHQIAGALVMPRGQFHVVEVGQRRMFVPIVMLDARWRSGLSVRRHGTDFMIGTAASGGKLGPIWLDKREHLGLVAQRYLRRPPAG